MSQHPPPYPPPPLPYHRGPGAPDLGRLLALTRRAGGLMIGLGALAVLFGLASAWHASRFDPADLNIPPEAQREMVKQLEEVEKQTGISARRLMTVAAAVPLVLGAVLGGLGFFVRGGRFGPVVGGLVLVALASLLLGMATLVGVAQGAAMGGPALALAVLLVYGVPLALMVFLLLLLVRAARLSSGVDLARQQMQAQMLYYQQQQQAFLRASPQPPAARGLGYHQYAPPKAPAAPPPVEPQDAHGTPPER